MAKDTHVKGVRPFGSSARKRRRSASAFRSPSVANEKIAIIGGGHMGTALALGLRANNHVRIAVSDSPRNNVNVSQNAEVIFIAVKPSVVASVLSDIKPFVKDKLVVSLAAGVRIAAIKKVVGRNVSVARIMPNIPVAEGEGVVGLCGTRKEKARLKSLLSGLGLIVKVQNERVLDAFTLIAGCGPGIVATFVEMVAKRARTLGIPASEELALQIFMGTIHHMISTRTSAARLIESVATKGGVTEAILQRLQKDGLDRHFAQAIQAGDKKLRGIKK